MIIIANTYLALPVCWTCVTQVGPLVPKAFGEALTVPKDSEARKDCDYSRSPRFELKRPPLCFHGGGNDAARARGDICIIKKKKILPRKLCYFKGFSYIGPENVREGCWLILRGPD